MHSTPSRREILKSGAGSAALLSAPWISRLGRARKERPNLVFLCSDQQHWRAFGHVDPFFDTPNIDSLAAEGMVFRQAYCSSPQCSPSRASMLTGFYPHRTGVMNNLGSPGGEGLKLPSVGRSLQEAGYHTVYLGKWHVNHQPEQVGWDESRMIAGDKKITQVAQKFLGRAAALEKPFALFLMYLEPHNVVQFQPSKKPPEDVGTVPLDVSWELEKFENKPVVQAHYMDTGETLMMKGLPRTAWQEFRLYYKRRVGYLDEKVGQLLDTLRSSGLRESTAVLLTSDHGEMDTYHHMIFKGPFMYDQLVRIPMIASLPERFGGRVGEADYYAWVNVDLVPTLLDLAAGEIPACDGRSAAPVLRGEEAEQRPFVVGQFYGKKGWISPIRMLRTPGYKYNLYIEHGEELYDLEQDPSELVNLADDAEHAARKAELRASLESWIAANDDPFHSFQASELRVTPLDRRRR